MKRLMRFVQLWCSRQFLSLFLKKTITQGKIDKKYINITGAFDGNSDRTAKAD